MHSVLALKLSVTKVVIRAVLTVGRKHRVDWAFYGHIVYKTIFQSFSFILVFISLILFKLLSYSLLFLNFRWFVLTV
jgi:phosphate/sulfate permease